MMPRYNGSPKNDRRAQAPKGRTQKFQKVDPNDAEDQFAGFDVFVTDDDAEVAKGLAEKAAELEAEAAARVTAKMQSEAEVEPDKGEAKAEEESEAEEPKVKPEPEPKADKPRTRPAQDPEPKPMTGEVTEQPTPRPAPAMPSQADGFTPEPPGWFMNEPLAPKIAKFVQEEIEAGRMLDFNDFCAEQEARRAYALYKVQYAEYVRRLYFEAEEAKKWKDVLLVDNGKTFIKDALEREFAEIDAHERWSVERKRDNKDESAFDLFAEAVARQRHCETNKIRKFETAEAAEEAKLGLRDEFWEMVGELIDGSQEDKPKKGKTTHSAGNSGK